MRRVRLVKEVVENGSVYYFTEKRSWFMAWLFVSGSLSLSERDARRVFEHICQQSKTGKQVLEVWPTTKKG